MKEKSSLILGIDTTKREEIALSIYGPKTKRPTFQTFKTDKQSEDILILIDRLIKNTNQTINDLKAILVNVSPGSYTGVRVGVTVANTLAWSLDIPVFGYLENNFDQMRQKAQNPSKGDRGFSKLALPTYLDT